MTRRILIVDDEESSRDNYTYFLSREGHTVDTAGSLKEARRMLEGQEYDLVVADILLGADSGLDVLAEVKSRGLRTPVVMITGQPTVATAAEAVRLGAFDYVPKPLRRETLVRIATMALHHKSLLDERDRLAAEKETFRSNLEAIFRSVQDGIVTVDRERRVLAANAAASAICGRSSDDLLGSEFCAEPWQCSRLCRKALDEALESKRPVWEYRIECSRRDAPEQVAVVTCFPYLTGREDFAGTVMVVRDITRLSTLERELKKRHRYLNMIGRSEKMQDIYGFLENLAETEAAVLITGESGTGKELAVEAIHYSSPRADKPLVKVNCSALSENLLESELFGHVRGAFTGAVRDKVGRFQMANGGTIFLDEIGDISPAIQLKLLRVLQEKEFERVGDSQTIKVDVRVIAATNRDLRTMIRDRSFREDLYYRLKVVEVQLPSLRERLEDVPLLVSHFLEQLGASYGRSITHVSDEVMQVFMGYQWPGNIRQLKHALEHAFILCRQPVISMEHLPSELRECAERQPEPAASNRGRLDREQVVEALEACAWKKAPAARRLGISRPTLYRKIREFGLESEAV